jgi:hypothetical protein
MDYEKLTAALEKMTPKERQVAMVLYMKDIKDLLQTLLESQGITPRHF